MLFELVLIACKSQNSNSPKAFLHFTLDTCSDSLVTLFLFLQRPLDLKIHLLTF